MRDSVFQATSPEAVRELYAALALFDRLAYAKENQIIYKMKEGKSARRVGHNWKSFSYRESLSSFRRVRCL